MEALEGHNQVWPLRLLPFSLPFRCPSVSSACRQCLMKRVAHAVASLPRTALQLLRGAAGCG